LPCLFTGTQIFYLIDKQLVTNILLKKGGLKNNNYLFALKQTVNAIYLPSYMYPIFDYNIPGVLAYA